MEIINLPKKYVETESSKLKRLASFEGKDVNT
jgi:hypothetical protein